MRHDGRKNDELRKVEVVSGFHRNAEGSVLYRAGNTVVLCTASVDAAVPPFLLGKGRGWVTAEYQMHPRAAPERREQRDGRGKAPSGRTQEIQRLIGRALRSAVVLEKLGERQIVVDCDVLEADGGTRTASITGGFIALAMALNGLHQKGLLAEPVVREQVAAVSVGLIGDELRLDLPYIEDSRAEVDLNLVATDRDNIIEVQGTAEGAPVPRKTMDGLVDLALHGVRQLAELQRRVLAEGKIDLAALLVDPAATKAGA